MGTRGVTIVVSDKKTKVAQYGQWDHNPSGQGVTILNFLKGMDLNRFKTQLLKCRFTDKKKRREINSYLKSIGSKDGWVNLSQSRLYDKKYPYFSRDYGAAILEMIYESKDETIWLNNEKSFVMDGLFCEYAYVVDLDKMTFEVYEGFNSNPELTGKRFKRWKPLVEKGKSPEYYGPVLVKSYKIDENLPDVKTFIKECEGNGEDEE